MTLAIMAIPLVGWGCSNSPPESVDTRTLNVERNASKDADAERRAADVERYLQANYYSRFTVLATTVNKMGETIDWVDPEELDPDFYKYPPERGPSFEGAEDRGAPNVAGNFGVPPVDEAQEENDDAQEWRGPDNLSGILRPNFGYYIDGKSDAETLDEFIDEIPQPQPATQFRLYTGRRYSGENAGSSAFMSMWNYGGDPAAANPLLIPSGGMSLSQTAAACGEIADGTMEAIEFGYQKLPSKYNDQNVHLFGFFRTAGSAKGNRIGGYNQDFIGFVSEPGAPLLGSAYTGSFSTVGGSVFAKQLTVYRSDSSPRWYLMLGTQVLGYYPIGAASPNIPFDLIDEGACRVTWWSEVYDPSPTQWDVTNAGSGSFINGTTPAYFRQLRVFRWPELTSFFFPANATAVPGMDAGCYNVGAVLTAQGGNPTFDPWFYYGGPGNDQGNAVGRPCQ